MTRRAAKPAAAGSPGSTSACPGSTFLAATLSTGTEYYYGAQLVGSGMIFSNDVYILGVRYADTPRARYGYRQDKLITGSIPLSHPSGA